MYCKGDNFVYVYMYVCILEEIILSRVIVRGTLGHICCL